MKTQTDNDFKSDWTPCSREWFADLAKFRSEQGKSPITDAILAADTGDSSLIFNLAQQCRKFESEHAALVAVAEAAQAMLDEICVGFENPADIKIAVALANLAEIRSNQ